MSSSTSRRSPSRFKFVNLRCRCNRNAKILISQTTENNGKLFFKCDCPNGIFKWWSEEELNLDLLRTDVYGEEVNQQVGTQETALLRQEINTLRDELKELKLIILRGQSDPKAELWKAVLLSYCVGLAMAMLMKKCI